MPTSHEVTLRLLGVKIGNWINGAPMAGETFGWGPAGSGALVFVGRGDRLTLIDQAKHTQASSPRHKDASLPRGRATARASRSCRRPDAGNATGS